MANRRTVVWVIVFSIAFALVESSVVVYLRDLYYPDGFSFPLRLIDPSRIAVELFREAATIVMLVSVGWLAGVTPWQKMAWFMVAFGVWDLFYYIWLWVIIGWPSSLFDPDILFLIPVPWIAPVFAPVVISIQLIVAGSLILMRERFSPTASSWWLAVAGTITVLYSFMQDTDAGLRQQPLSPFPYWIFLAGAGLYAAGMVAAFRGKSLRSEAG